MEQMISFLYLSANGTSLSCDQNMTSKQGLQIPCPASLLFTQKGKVEQKTFFFYF